MAVFCGFFGFGGFFVWLFFWCVFVFSFLGFFSPLAYYSAFVSMSFLAFVLPLFSPVAVWGGEQAGNHTGA